MKPSITDVTIEHNYQSPDCQKVNQVLARVGDKWSILIIMYLAENPRRFSELKRLVNGISQRMLTLCLRGLERDGLVKRTVLAVMPPHVEYELTPLGHSLTEPVIALGTWAQTNIVNIDEARIAYDNNEENRNGPKPWQD